MAIIAISLIVTKEIHHISSVSGCPSAATSLLSFRRSLQALGVPM